MQKIVNYCLNSLLKNIDNAQEEKAVYEYGLFMMIHTLLTNTCIIFLGFLWGRTIEMCLILFIFSTCQIHGGGYHANTHLQCFFTMIFGSFICLMSFSLHFSRITLLAIALLCFLLLLLVPLSLHPNKSFLSVEKKRLVHQSRIKTCELVLLFGIVLLFDRHCFTYAYVIALVCSTISRIIPKLCMKTATENFNHL